MYILGCYVFDLGIAFILWLGKLFLVYFVGISELLQVRIADFESLV